MASTINIEFIYLFDNSEIYKLTDFLGFFFFFKDDVYYLAVFD